jgi:hypothetical protein
MTKSCSIFRETVISGIHLKDGKKRLCAFSGLSLNTNYFKWLLRDGLAIATRHYFRQCFQSIAADSGWSTPGVVLSDIPIMVICYLNVAWRYRADDFMHAF